MPSRNPEVAAFQRRRIIEAATEVFEEKGFSGASMDQIAAAAGFTKRTIYAFFLSKSAIQLAIVLDGFLSLRDRLGAVASASLSFEENARGFLNAVSSEQTSQPYRTASMLQFAPPKTCGDDPASLAEFALVAQINAVGVELDGLMVQAFEAGRQAGKVRDGIDDRLAGMVLWAAMSAVVSLERSKADYLASDLGLTDDEFLAQACDILLSGIVKGV